MPVNEQISIRFFFHNVQVRLMRRKKFKSLILFLFQNEGKKLNSLDYIFCTDTFLLGLNRQHLKHDYYTDIITFDLTETKKIIGELYISIDRIKENAPKFNTSIQDELYRVMIHGALHLCGFKDKTSRQKAEIRKKENFYLTKFYK